MSRSEREKQALVQAIMLSLVMSAPFTAWAEEDETLYYLSVDESTSLSAIDSSWFGNFYYSDQDNDGVYASYTRYGIYNSVSASNNVITVSGVDLDDVFASEDKTNVSIVGGYAEGANDVKNNSVTLSNGEAYNVYGGLNFSNSGVTSSSDAVVGGEVSGNAVTINGVDSSVYTVYGGYSWYQGTVTGNTVTVSALSDDGSYATVAAGDDETKTVEYGKSVDYIAGSGTYSVNEVIGGYSHYGGTVSNNTVYLTNTIVDEVNGGYVYYAAGSSTSNYGKAEYNKVYITGSTVSYAYGAYMGNGEANYNEVILEDSYVGPITKTTQVASSDDEIDYDETDVFGAWVQSEYSSATGNKVTVKDSTLYSYWTAGAYYNNDSTDNAYKTTYSNNGVELTGATQVLVDEDYFDKTFVVGALVKGKANAEYNYVTIDLDSTDCVIEAEVDGVLAGINENSTRKSSGDLKYNTVTIKNGKVTGGIGGAVSVYAENTSGTKSLGRYIVIEENTVNIEGGVIDNNEILGGYLTVGYASLISNSVNISGNSQVTTEEAIAGAYGYHNNTGTTISFSDNKVTINLESEGYVKAGLIAGAYEGYGKTDIAVRNNSVAISAGSVEADICGAYYGGVLVENTVTISGGSVKGYIYGAYSCYGTPSYTATASDDSGISYSGASANTVTVSGGSVEGSITGGYIYGQATGSAFTADYNEVDISDASVSGDDAALVGGEADAYLDGKSSSAVATDASYNRVSVKTSTDGGSSLAEIVGGRAYSQSGSTSSATHEYGANSDAKANSNTVTLNDDKLTVSGPVYGGDAYAASLRYSTSESVSSSSATAVASSNSITISAGSVKGGIYGGAAGAVAYIGNYGSASTSVTVYGNTIYLYGGTIAGGVYASYVYDYEAVDSVSVTNNTITLTGDADISAASIYGSNIYSAESDWGNDLIIKSGYNTAESVANFDTIRFEALDTQDDGVDSVTLVATDGAVNIGGIYIYAEGLDGLTEAGSDATGITFTVTDADGISSKYEASSVKAQDMEDNATILWLGKVTVSDNIIEAVTDEDGNYNIETNVSVDAGYITAERSEGGLYVNEISSDGYYLTDGKSYEYTSDANGELAVDTTDINIGVAVTRSIIAETFVDTDGTSTSNKTEGESDLVIDASLNDVKSGTFAGVYNVSDSAESAGVTGAALTVTSSYTGTYEENNETVANGKNIYAGYSENGDVTCSSITLDSNGVTASYANLYGSNSYADGAGNTLYVTGTENTVASVNNFNIVYFDVNDSTVTYSLTALENATNIGAINIDCADTMAQVASVGDLAQGESAVYATVEVSNSILSAAPGSDDSGEASVSIQVLGSDALGDGWYTAERTDADGEASGGIYINHNFSVF